MDSLHLYQRSVDSDWSEDVKTLSWGKSLCRDVYLTFTEEGPDMVLLVAVHSFSLK